MKKQINIGDKFGHVSILEELPPVRTVIIRHERMFRVVCECGKTKDMLLWNIIRRQVNLSCGCKVELGKNFYKHGLSRHPLYRVRSRMISRCIHKSCKHYKDYGGRGIIVCDEWMNDFVPFYQWSIDNGYAEGLEIDRIDVNGNYEPSNCRWVTKEINSNNRRTSIHFNYNGEILSLPQIARKEGINYSALRYRVRDAGVDLMKAVEVGKRNDKLPRGRNKKSKLLVCEKLGLNYKAVLSRAKYRKITFEESVNSYLK